ncbi:hypothetical protein BDZ89DRAFT_1055400 [Hymenopellis radicata]|nr:hypothetical protein BDZ89DRAFT_1055400 [Hymenopellis radicata]
MSAHSTNDWRPEHAHAWTTTGTEDTSTTASDSCRNNGGGTLVSNNQRHADLKDDLGLRAQRHDTSTSSPTHGDRKADGTAIWMLPDPLYEALKPPPDQIEDEHAWSKIRTATSSTAPSPGHPHASATVAHRVHRLDSRQTKHLVHSDIILTGSNSDHQLTLRGKSFP